MCYYDLTIPVCVHKYQPIKIANKQLSASINTNQSQPAIVPWLLQHSASVGKAKHI